MFVDLVCVVASGSSQTGVCVCVQRRKALVKLSFGLPVHLGEKKRVACNYLFIFLLLLLSSACSIWSSL